MYGSTSTTASPFWTSRFPTAGSNWYLVRDDFEHMMRSDPTALPGLSLMAFEDGRPVGVCINFVDTMRPDAGHIGMLGVARSARRRGIGRTLFNESLTRFAAAVMDACPTHHHHSRQRGRW